MRKRIAFIMATVCVWLIAGCGDSNSAEVSTGADNQMVENAEQIDTKENTASENIDDSSVIDDSACYPGIIYNEVDAVDTVMGFDVTGRKLTEEQLEMVLPDILFDWTEPSGTALYYGWEELAYVSVTFPSIRWKGQVEVSIQNADEPIYSDIIVETADRVSRFGNVEYTAYQFVDSENEAVLLWVVFEREGISYSIFTNTNLSNIENAKTDIHNMLQLYAETETVPDLELLTFEDRDMDTNVSFPLDGVTMEVTEYSDTNAEELADTFGILISLPVNSNWTVDSEHYLVDENNLRISYHDSIADADCTLLVSKNNNLNLPQAEYDETLNESWEGYTIGRQHIVVKVQHKKNDEKKVLATWKYNKYQFAIIGEDVNDSTPIPKVALYIINRLD